jgi:prolyl-tRNA synthetase
MSAMHLNTLRAAPGDAEIPSHIWLLRSGMIRQTVSGVYAFMPLGWRTVRKIEQIVREEMDRAGALELSTSPVQPAELWHESGRWPVYGPELWRLKDRHGREFALGPTAEEIMTDIVRSDITSYRQLPVNFYQIQLKYRDEARPRYGLIRSREFIMKDAYSFDRDEAGLDESYRLMRDAYTRVFERCGLEFWPVAADNGPIGGSGSEEFMAISDVGESDIIYCDACDMAATSEQAVVKDAPAETEAELELEEVPTPGKKTIADVAGFLELPREKTLKALLFQVYEDEPDERGEYRIKEYLAVFIRGDRELNMVKLRNALGGIGEHLLEFADEKLIGEATGSVGGYTGPVGLHDIRVIADSEVPGLKNLCAGALREGFHLKNVNYGRDWTAETVVDLKLASADDVCPVCGAPLKQAKGIEVGQIFKLGTRYSDAMGACYTDENMKEHLVWMGCYGIGVTRTMAAVAEQSHDDRGIIWPLSVAPCHAIVLTAKQGDTAQAELAERIYSELSASGVETLLDDRDERFGVKANDADILGIPIRITVGKKAEEGVVEYKLRTQGGFEEVCPEEAIERARNAVASI